MRVKGCERCCSVAFHVEGDHTLGATVSLVSSASPAQRSGVAGAIGDAGAKLASLTEPGESFPLASSFPKTGVYQKTSWNRLVIKANGCLATVRRRQERSDEVPQQCPAGICDSKPGGFVPPSEQPRLAGEAEGGALFVSLPDSAHKCCERRGRVDWNRHVQVRGEVDACALERKQRRGGLSND